MHPHVVSLVTHTRTFQQMVPPVASRMPGWCSPTGHSPIPQSLWHNRQRVCLKGSGMQGRLIKENRTEYMQSICAGLVRSGRQLIVLLVGPCHCVPTCTLSTHSSVVGWETLKVDLGTFGSTSFQRLHRDTIPGHNAGSLLRARWVITESTILGHY